MNCLLFWIELGFRVDLVKCVEFVSEGILVIFVDVVSYLKLKGDVNLKSCGDQ